MQLWAQPDPGPHWRFGQAPKFVLNRNAASSDLEPSSLDVRHCNPSQRAEPEPSDPDAHPSELTRAGVAGVARRNELGVLSEGAIRRLGRHAAHAWFASDRLGGGRSQAGNEAVGSGRRASRQGTDSSTVEACPVSHRCRLPSPPPADADLHRLPARRHRLPTRPTNRAVPTPITDDPEPPSRRYRPTGAGSPVIEESPQSARPLDRSQPGLRVRRSQPGLRGRRERRTPRPRYPFHVKPGVTFGSRPTDAIRKRAARLDHPGATRTIRRPVAEPPAR